MVIYLDVLIFQNFIVNLFLLVVTSQTLKISKKILSYVLAAFLGSLYVLVIIYPSLNFFSSIIFKILVAFFIVWIAFRKNNIFFNLKATAIYICYSMIIAGICIFMECSYNSSSFNIIIGNFSYKKLLMALMILYIVASKVVWFIKDRKDISQFIYDVNIVLNNRITKVKAFLDTGNELREPATNLPVIIVDREVFLNINLDDYDKFYIPYSVINGHSGNLKGFKPEGIYIGDEKKQAIIGISEEKLSSIKDYQALLSRGIV
ncbi:sigma-E processing peptidase SpoIIGA [Clostridium oceanicum]|uniref:Sigma-E processing peptidase SpoIIGA n=1 Tax=Clostridium oceanicum TaxID=1543 RepID=A0ABN1JB67_9CLOT